MIKKRAVAIFFMFLAGTIFAEGSSFSFEIYGGIGQGGSIEEVDGFDPSLEIERTKAHVRSGTVGLRTHYYLTESLSFVSGIAYAIRRLELVIVDKTYYETQISGTVKREYLQVPLMFRWGSGFYIAGGGYFGFQLGDAVVEETDTDFPESVQNKTDYGVMAEIGYRFFDTVSLAVNMEIGIPYVIEFPENESLGFKMRNAQISLFLGIEFDLLN
jgi:hypothetical protein